MSSKILQPFFKIVDVDVAASGLSFADGEDRIICFVEASVPDKNARELLLLRNEIAQSSEWRSQF